MMDIRALGYVVVESTDLGRWEHFATRVAGLGVSEVVVDDSSLVEVLAGAVSIGVVVDG